MTTLLPIALSLLVQSTALLLLGLVAMQIARRHGPAVQSLLGRATLAGVALALLLAGPLAGHVKPVWSVGESTPQIRSNAVGIQVAAPPATGGERVKTVMEAPLVDGASLGPAVSGRATLGQTHMTEGTPDNHPAPPLTPSAPPPPPPVAGGEATCMPTALLRICGVGCLWAAGTALLLVWLALCQGHLTRLRRQAAPVTSGPAAEMLAALTTRPPLLLTHPSVRSPFLAGLRRPAIFLPTAPETEFDPASLRAILAHELAHLARRDNAWTLAARLLTALLWPQPLLWTLCRRLEQCGEEACDLAVLAQDCPPRAYANCLLTLAERHPLGRRERALGVGVAPFRSSLGRRIGRILDKGTHAMSVVTLRLRLTVAALAVAAALGGIFLVSSAPAQSLVPVSVTPTPEQQRFNAMRSQDATNLRTIGIALTQYVQDNDEFYPRAAHWMDDLSPYLKDKTVLFDPFQPGARRYGYALNRTCSGKSLAAFAHPWETIAVFDSTLGTRNASDTSESLRVSGTGGMSGSNYLFVDEHVKWSHGAGKPSFAVKWDPRWHDSPPPGYYSGKNVTHSSRPTLTRILAWRNRGSSSVVENKALGQARFLAGLTPVQGPGVVVTLKDGKKHLPNNLPPGMAPPSIIHDSDINQIVNELKAAGAEAIAVNDQRLVATSSVRTAGPTVLINFVPTAPPYVIKAIGDPKTLAAAMNLPGGVASQIKMYDPAMFSVKESGMLTLPAYSGRSEPRYAKPVASISPGQGQAVIGFLDAEIRTSEQRSRAAERAVSVYKAEHHPATMQSQQELARLTRDFSSATTLLTTLMKKRQEVGLQLGLAQLTSQYNGGGTKTDAQQRTIETLQSRLLIQKRQQLEAQLSALDAQSAALTAYTQALRTHSSGPIKWVTLPLSHGTNSRSQVDLKMQALRSQLAAARTDLDLKEATMTPLNPVVIAAKREVQALEQACREQPIRDKQEFVKEVHRYNQAQQQEAAFVAVANTTGAAAHQINTIHRQQRQLQSMIASLDAQIARHRTPASGR